MNRTSVVIVGGGLSGLYAAHRLEQAGLHDYVVLEARHRLGGRLLSESADEARFDLGATWYWPDMQPQLDELVRALGLRTFPQHEAGMMVFEQSATAPARHFEGLQGESTLSMRIKGGMARLVDALAAQVPGEKIRMGHGVRHIERLTETDTRVEAVTAGGEVHEIIARHVLLALPPRLVAERIRFEPPLPDPLARAWADCPTWMAPHAKYVAVYPRPFWRAQGLSGSARSYAGPMVEIHDASPAKGMGAIFGFVGVPAATRQRIPAAALIDLCRAQMGRLFGPEALHPTAEWLKDWSTDAFTATPADTVSAGGHATAPPAAPRDGTWRGRITGIASEWSALFPGYVAGAIDAAAEGAGTLLVEL
jgi:monoamine oxidase